MATDDDLMQDALAFGALVGGESEKWIIWAVATIRDRNERMAELEKANKRLRIAADFLDSERGDQLCITHCGPKDRWCVIAVEASDD